MWVWAAVCQLQEDHNLKLTASEILALSRENEETELRCVGQLAWFETAWLKRASFGSGGACWCMQADSAKAHKVKDSRKHCVQISDSNHDCETYPPQKLLTYLPSRVIISGVLRQQNG